MGSLPLTCVGYFSAPLFRGAQVELVYLSLAARYLKETCCIKQCSAYITKSVGNLLQNTSNVNVQWVCFFS